MEQEEKFMPNEVRGTESVEWWIETEDEPVTGDDPATVTLMINQIPVAKFKAVIVKKRGADYGMYPFIEFKQINLHSLEDV